MDPSTWDPSRYYHQLVDNAGDGIVLADRDGVIRLWNKGAEALFGYSQEEALGKSLDLIVPERFRERHWEGYRRVMATGVTRYGDRLLSVPAARKDGSRISIDFTLTLLRDSDGKVAGAGAIVRDVTEQWRREKALKESLEALERAKGPGNSSGLQVK